MNIKNDRKGARKHDNRIDGKKKKYKNGLYDSIVQRKMFWVHEFVTVFLITFVFHSTSLLFATKVHFTQSSSMQR